MTDQINELLAQIDFDTERLKTLQIEIATKNLQVMSIANAIRAKHAMVSILTDAAKRESARRTRVERFLPIEFKPLPIGAITFEDEAEHDWRMAL